MFKGFFHTGSSSTLFGQNNQGLANQSNAECCTQPGDAILTCADVLACINANPGAICASLSAACSFVFGTGTTNRATMWTSPTTVGDGSWAFSGASYFPVTPCSDLGTPANRIGTIYLCSILDYATSLVFSHTGTPKFEMTSTAMKVKNGVFIESDNGLIQADFGSGTYFRVATDGPALATHLIWITPTFSFLGISTVNLFITAASVKQNFGTNYTELTSLNYKVAVAGNIDLDAASPTSNIFLKADTRITNGKLFTSTDTNVSMDFGSGAYWSVSVSGADGFLVNALTATMIHTSNTATGVISVGTLTPMVLTLDKLTQIGNFDVNGGTLKLGQNAILIEIGNIAGAKTINIGATGDTINSVGTWNHTGDIDSSGSVRSTDAIPAVFASGAGVQLSGLGLLGYDYTGAVYNGILYDGANHAFQIAGIDRVLVSAIGNLVVGMGATDSGVAQFWMKTGTPTAVSIADQFTMYSNDIVAGNAAPHFRTEVGDIIKIFADAGWGTPTGTFDKTTFDTTTVTLQELAERVAAVINTLKNSHGVFKA
jgi:hypothetical protein